MSEYDVPEKYRVIIKGLKKLGLDCKPASRHDVATCPRTGNKTTIPRHAKDLNKYTVGSIYDFLIENGYKKEDIKKAFKWK
jgi:hypothetical protein